MLDYVGLDKCQRLFILVVLTYVYVLLHIWAKVGANMRVMSSADVDAVVRVGLGAATWRTRIHVDAENGCWMRFQCF